MHVCMHVHTYTHLRCPHCVAAAAAAAAFVVVVAAAGRLQSRLRNATHPSGKLLDPHHYSHCQLRHLQLEETCGVLQVHVCVRVCVCM